MKKNKYLPFYVLLAMTFGTASFEKIAGGEIPNWFLKQFEPSILNLFPGSLAMSFILIAVLESMTFLLLILGILKNKYFINWGIFLAQITFIILSFGQRLTHNYEAAATLFFYAVLTFIAGQLISNDESKTN